MPQIKSAKKRVKQTAKRTLRNKSIKSAVKTEQKKMMALITAGDKVAALARLPETVSVIDSAVSKGVLKKNTASRKKSNIMLKINAMA
ncbi:MAG: 30S ribosomal protein S20 [Clostridia bacterium]|nr:30S ribosomal protein S20 [Clostridia bacterium]